MNGRIREAAMWLEACRRGRDVVDGDNSGRSLPQHMLGMAGEADGQVKKAIKLLDHVVATETRVFRDDYPPQPVSLKVLA
jgi:hypothetical protein